MKKIFVVLMMSVIYACTPGSMITGSWKSPQAPVTPYNSILVDALTNHAVAKSTLENDIADLLVPNGINTYKGIELFPMEISNTDSDRSVIMSKVRGMNIDAILTISIIKSNNESRYVLGPDPYDPFFHYPFYTSFWGYYSYYYPSFYSPAYYTEKVYYLETNLYDAKTENLVWSAQSDTYDLLNLAPFSRQFATSIVNKMVQDGMIKGVVRQPEESVE